MRRLLSILMQRDFRNDQENITFSSLLRCIVSDGLLSVCRRTSSVYRSIEEEKDGRSEAMSLKKMEKKGAGLLSPVVLLAERTGRGEDCWCLTWMVLSVTR